LTRIDRLVFGETREEKPVHLYILRNSSGAEARITNYGGILVSLAMPDKKGELSDIVLGYDTLEEYIRDDAYFGCIVGRYANRIARGRFTLDGKEHRLSVNDGQNHLHGGTRGFNRAIWDCKVVEEEDRSGVVLFYLSHDGEEGYPGNLSTLVTYSLTNENELRLEYKATTEADTVVNLSHHSYFNLAGHGAGDVLGHVLTINANRFTPVDKGLIPTGKVRSVEGTPMDFRKPTPIGEMINRDHGQIKIAGGFDHNFVLDKAEGEVELAARLYEPSTGRTMEVLTTEPGVQFYSGNFLKAVKRGKNGSIYGPHHGLCLETQHFPDSPNKPHFPSTVLRAGEEYRQTTVYRFTVED
jgi:aldose 1-epimerase